MKALTRMLLGVAVTLSVAGTGISADYGIPAEPSRVVFSAAENRAEPAAASDVPERLPAATPAQDPMVRRLAELEAEQDALRAEIQWLREHPNRMPTPSATPVSLSTELTVPETPPADGDVYFTFDELAAEMKKFAWTKGDFRIVPYGSLWGSAIYATERTYPGPYTLWVYSPDDHGEDTFVIDTRRTRMGLDIAGPRIPMFCNAKSGGKIEIDFHGAFVVENKPGVLLRHAYGEVKNENFRLLAGQTWDIISPLYPDTLSYSVGWAGGNIGYRRAQIRYERYVALSNTCLLTGQISVNQNIISDFNGNGSRPEATGWPVIEGRTAVTLGSRRGKVKPITIGLSGHIGEQGADFLTAGPAPYFLPPQDDFRVRTWSANVDVYVPITERFGFKGEFFTGENLSTFLGGIVQGVNVYTRRPIRATGGWFEFWYDWTPRMHTHVGYSIDDPVNTDLTVGRTYNEFVFANGVFDVTKSLQVGLEVTNWKTNHIGHRPGESVQVEFTGKYGF